MKTQVGGRPSEDSGGTPIPIVAEMMNVRAWHKERNGLIVLRSVFLGLLVTLFGLPYCVGMCPEQGGELR
jgi:hypothetical protein